MKRILVATTLLAILTIGCKDKKDVSTKTVNTTDAIHEKEMENHEDGDGALALDNSWTNEIQLNDGKKWDANRETSEGVDNMLILVSSTQPSTPEGFHILASKLNDEKNKLVKKCTMEGPAHDNLHIFLHPLIEKIAALGEVSTEEEGKEIKMSIKENLEKYREYFR